MRRELPGFWQWKEPSRSVKKSEKGIRILAPIVGVCRKKQEEAERGITKQNVAVLVGFRSAYVFDVSQTEGAELPTMREICGDAGENRDRLLSFIREGSILDEELTTRPIAGVDWIVDTGPVVLEHQHTPQHYSPLKYLATSWNQLPSISLLCKDQGSQSATSVS